MIHASGLLSKRPAGGALLAALALALCTVPAYGQAPRPERPYRGLFGSGTGDFEQQLTAHASLGSAYDDNLVAEATGSNKPHLSDLAPSNGGYVGTMSGSLNYFLARSRYTANASGGTFARYYPSFATSFVRRDYASGGINANISKELTAGMNASYQPYSLQAILPVLMDPRGEDLPINEDFPSSTQQYVSYGANTAYNHQFSARTRLGLDASYHVRDSVSETPFRSHTAGGLLSHNLSRDLALDLGYHYTIGFYSNGRNRPLHQVINAGVRYNKALSISRTTHVGFSSGMSAVRSPTTQRTQVRAVGSADLSHEFGRSWSGVLMYNRAVHFAENWVEPIFYDSFTAGLSGLITQRLQVHANASKAVGNRAFDPSNSTKFNTFYSGAGVSYAVNRFISANLMYAYYNHEFSDLLILAPGFPTTAARRSVHASVSFWAPVFQRAARRQ